MALEKVLGVDLVRPKLKPALTHFCETARQIFKVQRKGLINNHY